MNERHNRHSTNTDSAQEGSASGKSNKVKTKKSASEQHLSHDHFDFMLDWLGRPGNYTRVFGASGNTTIGVKDNKSVKVAIEEWVNHVSKAGSFQLTGVALKARFTQYLGIYKDIKRVEQATGYGLSEDDYNKNIRTLAQKYGKECYAFERMDRIFNRNDDEGTIIGQANDAVLSAEDDGVVLKVQDRIFSVESDPLEGTERVEEEVAAPAELKKDLEQDKLDWDNEKWRLECQLRKEEREIRKEEHQALREELEIRKEERKEERKVKHMADIESKRLAAIVALVQQGIADKDVILSIVGSGSKNE
ncbi:hypothetical protein BGX24_004683 [Mortierella sp. AD032]|nr:hypothetical protein BGX24_004683 [Mortierella sp. AD032]